MRYGPSVRSRWLVIGQVLFLHCSIHKLAKKEQGQYPAILTKQTWSIKDLLYGFWFNFSCGTFHLARSGSQSQDRFSFILPAHGANHIIILF